MSERKSEKQANRAIREKLAAQRRRRRQRAMWASIVAIAVLLGAGIIGWSLLRSQTPETFASPTGVTDVGGDRAGIIVAGTGPTTVEVYLDFLCPACKAFEDAATPTINQMIAANKITLIWHTLGFLNTSTIPSGYSTRAANAAACAADDGKLKEYGETLFANQPAEGGPGLTDDRLIDLGGPVGLNAPSFAACVREQKYHDWVSNVNDRAGARGVRATPTIYVNGTPLAQPTLEAFVAAVG